jgi:hypothetical protein
MFRRASLYKPMDIVLEMRRKFNQHGVARVLSVAAYEVFNHASCNQNAVGSNKRNKRDCTSAHTSTFVRDCLHSAY